MPATLLEKLPNNLALYKIAMDEVPQVGQWLTANNKNYALFNYSDGYGQFIACANELLPEKFTLTGEAIHLSNDDSSLFLLADSKAIPLVFFLINHLKFQWGIKKLRAKISLILMACEEHFPFKPVPSQIMLPDIPDELIASSQLLEDFSLPARLACNRGSPGCFEGSAEDMLELINVDKLIDAESSVICFGSNSLLQKTKKLFIASHSKQFYVHFD